jgi:preprotein translocase subunit SecA
MRVATQPPKAPIRSSARAQQRVERRRFRDRKVVLYNEKERQKVERQVGQYPYLDTPG